MKEDIGIVVRGRASSSLDENGRRKFGGWTEDDNGCTVDSISKKTSVVDRKP